MHECMQSTMLVFVVRKKFIEQYGARKRTSILLKKNKTMVETTLTFFYLNKIPNFNFYLIFLLHSY